MISEQKILERIKHYKNELIGVTDTDIILDYSARINELEYVLNKPKVHYQIIGGSEEAKAEIENTLKKFINTL